MDRISSCSQGPEGVWAQDNKMLSLLVANIAVLLVPSSQGIQHALGWIQAKSEGVGMKIRGLCSQAEKVACSLQVGGEILPHVFKFKYFGVFRGTMEWRMDIRMSNHWTYPFW